MKIILIFWLLSLVYIICRRVYQHYHEGRSLTDRYMLYSLLLAPLLVLLIPVLFWDEISHFFISESTRRLLRHLWEDMTKFELAADFED